MAHVVDIRGQHVRPEIRPVLADPAGARARWLARFGRVVALAFLLWLVGLGLAGLGILPAADVPLGRSLTGTASLARGMALAPMPQARSDPAAATPTGSVAAPRAAGRATLSGARLAPGMRGGAVVLPSYTGSIVSRRSGSSAPLSTLGGLGASGSALGPGHTGSRGSGVGGSTATPVSGATAAPASGTASADGGPKRGTTLGKRQGVLTAPGQVVKLTTRGNAGSTARGNSGAPPGQVKAETTTAATATFPPTTSRAATTTTPGRSGTSPGHTGTAGGGHGNGA